MRSTDAHRWRVLSATADVSAPTRLVLVRHAATDQTADQRYSGRSDVALSREGEDQAGRVAARLGVALPAPTRRGVDEFLLHVDGWLCEVKDAQIHDGLHWDAGAIPAVTAAVLGSDDPRREAVGQVLAFAAGRAVGVGDLGDAYRRRRHRRGARADRGRADLG